MGRTRGGGVPSCAFSASTSAWHAACTGFGSPAASNGRSCAIVSSTTCPAGTISHTTRGVGKADTAFCRFACGTIPRASACWRAASPGS